MTEHDAKHGGGADWASLRDFVAKPLRLCPGNYRGAADAYRADRGRIVRDRQDARLLIAMAEAGGIPASAVSAGRLSWSTGHGWHYVAGQYYPTEVCAAVCAAVSVAIRAGAGHAGHLAWYITNAGHARSGVRRLARWFR